MSENDSETALWYAVATRARDEAIAKANLQRQDYSVFFAHYQPKKAPPGRCMPVIEPLFPGY